MDITIRHIRLDDAAGFNAALDSVARERRFLRLTSAPSIERSAAFVADNLAKGNPQFVAVDAARIVGWCDICRSDASGSEHCGSLGMGVIAEYRGKGIGSRLLSETIKAARGNFHRIELDVYAGNTSAIALYEKAGFAHEGRRRQALMRDGQHEDILIMAMLLN